MKFDYYGASAEKKCVAFLDDDGDFWVLIGWHWKCVSGDYDDNLLDEGNAIHKFYPGDKITITF